MDLTKYSLRADGEKTGQNGEPYFVFTYPNPPISQYVALQGIEQVEYSEATPYRTIITVIYAGGQEEESFGAEPAAVELFRQAVQKYNLHFKR